MNDIIIMSEHDRFHFKSIKQINNGYLYSIHTSNNEYLYIDTPFMSVPFGVEKMYQYTILKLQFDDTKNTLNSKMMEFYNFIKEFEDKIKEDFMLQYNLTDIILNTQIVNKEKYDDLLIVKCNKKSHNIEICKENGEIQSIYNIERNTILKCNVYINNIWVDNNTISYKLNINKIILKHV